MTPPFQWMAMDAEFSPLSFSSLTPRCRLVPRALLLLSPSSLSLLSFVLPSSVWIQIFHLSSQGVLPVFTWSSVRTAASLDVLDASTWWAWVWVNSGSLWWTGRPGMLWFMGSQRVGHDWTTDLNWTDSSVERDVPHFYLPLHHLVHPDLWMY